MSAADILAQMEADEAKEAEIVKAASAKRHRLKRIVDENSQPAIAAAPAAADAEMTEAPEADAKAAEDSGPDTQSEPEAEEEYITPIEPTDDESPAPKSKKRKPEKDCSDDEGAEPRPPQKQAKTAAGSSVTKSVVVPPPKAKAKANKPRKNGKKAKEEAKEAATTTEEEQCKARQTQWLADLPVVGELMFFGTVRIERKEVKRAPKKSSTVTTDDEAAVAPAEKKDSVIELSAYVPTSFVTERTRFNLFFFLSDIAHQFCPSTKTASVAVLARALTHGPAYCTSVLDGSRATEVLLSADERCQLNRDALEDMERVADPAEDASAERKRERVAVDIQTLSALAQMQRVYDGKPTKDGLFTKPGFTGPIKDAISELLVATMMFRLHQIPYLKGWGFGANDTGLPSDFWQFARKRVLEPKAAAAAAAIVADSDKENATAKAADEKVVVLVDSAKAKSKQKTKKKAKAKATVAAPAAVVANGDGKHHPEPVKTPAAAAAAAAPVAAPSETKAEKKEIVIVPDTPNQAMTEDNDTDIPPASPRPVTPNDRPDSPYNRKNMESPPLPSTQPEKELTPLPPAAAAPVDTPAEPDADTFFD